MKNLILLSSFLLSTSVMLAQSCLLEGILFTTQGQIDSFAINYPGCTQIQGYVKIQSPEVVSLTGLDSITHIGGYLTIGNTGLIDFEDFPLLTAIAGNLNISNNPFIQDIGGFAKLDTIEGNLSISYNPDLEDVSGFSSLKHVAQNLRFTDNIDLENVTGFNQLETIGDILGWGEFQCYSLTSIDGFASLRTIGSNLFIGSTPMAEINGFPSLDSIGGSLALVYNDNLTSLAGLADLDFLGSGASFYFNPLLSFCSIPAVCENLINFGGNADIYDNAAGCNSKEEVIAACIMATEDLFHSDLLQASPNPTTGQLRLRIDPALRRTPCQWLLVDAQGVHRQPSIPLTDESIDLSAFPNGVYLLLIQEQDNGITRAAQRVVLLR